MFVSLLLPKIATDKRNAIKKKELQEKKASELLVGGEGRTFVFFGFRG
jgi:hypothetical protein